MSQDLVELERKMDAAREQAKTFAERLRACEKEYALAVAESLGIRIGSVIKTKGHGSKRLRVTSIDFKGYVDPPLRIVAVTIRKDGTGGARHEIWEKFDVERM
jgi:hypothetical protein